MSSCCCFSFNQIILSDDLFIKDFFSTSSLALVLLRIKVRHEKSLTGWSIKRFMISRVGIYGVTFAIFSACLVVSVSFSDASFRYTFK